MAKYRAHYLRNDLSRRFRELPAASAKKQVRARDYPVNAEIEAEGEYAAWHQLQAFDSGQPGEAAGRAFAVGDVLEAEDGKLFLCLFGGFEEASWWVPEASAEAVVAALPGGEQPQAAGPAPDREPQPVPEPHPRPEPPPEPPAEPFPGPPPERPVGSKQ